MPGTCAVQVAPPSLVATMLGSGPTAQACRGSLAASASSGAPVTAWRAVQPAPEAGALPAATATPVPAPPSTASAVTTTVRAAVNGVRFTIISPLE